MAIRVGEIVRNYFSLNSFKKHISAINGAPFPRRTQQYPAEPQLFEIFVWQEVCSNAKKRREQAWTSAQEAGLMPDDDALRKLAGEEVTMATGHHFVATAKVSEPIYRFDIEDYVMRVSKRWKIPHGDLEKMVESSKLECAPSLTKRVTET